MAIKFDELLEALDPSLDEYPDESLNNSDIDKGYTYKGYRIIYTNGMWHVFFGNKGTGRVDFSTDKEAEEYIDNLLGD